MKAAFEFRAVAVDETEHWNLPDVLAGATAFGVYMFAVGEATHICSFTPSSGAEFLRNDFATDQCADPDAAAHYLRDGDGADLVHENGGEGFDYLSYQDVTDPARAPYLSQPLKITVDSECDDFDRDAYASALAKALANGESPQKARALANREALRQAAWDQALEHMNGNWPDVPVTWGKALDEHRARKARRAAAMAARYAPQAPVAPTLDVRA